MQLVKVHSYEWSNKLSFFFKNLKFKFEVFNKKISRVSFQ